MAEKALEVYQGNDWLTYRWPVAQMFDTLDRIRDLCHSTHTVSAVLPPLLASPLPRYEMHEAHDDDRHDLFLCIVEFCDDLSAEIDAVQADLFPYLQKDAAHRWMGFEMRLHLKEMRTIAMMQYKALDPSGNAVDAVLALNARIRDLLRSIDQ
jgi:hypothetical protein